MTARKRIRRMLDAATLLRDRIGLRERKARGEKRARLNRQLDRLFDFERKGGLPLSATRTTPNLLDSVGNPARPL